MLCAFHTLLPSIAKHAWDKEQVIPTSRNRWHTFCMGVPRPLPHWHPLKHIPGGETTVQIALPTSVAWGRSQLYTACQSLGFWQELGGKGAGQDMKTDTGRTERLWFLWSWCVYVTLSTPPNHLPGSAEGVALGTARVTDRTLPVLSKEATTRCVTVLQ